MLNGREQTAVLLVSRGELRSDDPLLLKHWNFSDLHESFCFHIFVFSLALLLDFSDVLDSLCYMFPICASLRLTCWTDRMRVSQKTVAWSFVFFCSWSK